MALRQQFGHLGRDAAHGVPLRHDHGSGFMADAFRTRIRARGMTPGFAFVGQPETNGVVERVRVAIGPEPMAPCWRPLDPVARSGSLRTVKEQIVHGRVYETTEDVREAVRAFIARDNAGWLVEKNGYLSPAALRRQHDLAAIPMAA